MQIVGMKTTNKWTPINKSVKAGTLPADNYSGFKIGDQVKTESGKTGEVIDVRFQNTPSSAFYTVLVHVGLGDIRSFYPTSLTKI